jgi:hypothetical protein
MNERRRMMRRITGAVLVALVAMGTAVGQDSKSTVGTDTTPGVVRKTITGQCHCGYIKYEAQGPVIESNYCDCRGCKRATGTMKSAILVVPRAGFKIVAGETASFRATTGEKCDAHGVWYFCPKCGSQVYWKCDNGNKFDIFAGTLDDLTLFQPKE